MKKAIRDFISTLNTYEKQELIKVLTEEIHVDHNKMMDALSNINDHAFGMIYNSEHNKLNELTLTQLGRIDKLSKEKIND